MMMIKCKSCGGDMELSKDRSVATCQYCGVKMTMPKIEDAVLASSFDRGNGFRMAGEFDKALAVYEKLVQTDSGNAEAHWCCVLCRYGIEYVKDPATGRQVPTCHRASFDSVLNDIDYLKALQFADDDARQEYQRQAQEIAEIQRGILAVSQKEKPYDVFICYKETDENGQRTRDSARAQELYYALTEQGYRVFFARITLEDKVGREYEPYIFSALNTARVMVVLGDQPRHFKAPWVVNEWSRFLKLAARDRSRLLLPCYEGMDPYDLPDRLSVLQCYDMGRIGFMQDLIRGIGKVIGTGAEAPRPSRPQPRTEDSRRSAVVTAESLMKRANLFLQDGNEVSAEEYYNRVLSMDPEYARAYAGLLCIDLGVTSLSKVGVRDEMEDPVAYFAGNTNFQKALSLGDDRLKEQLRGIYSDVTGHFFQKKYRAADETLRSARTPENALAAAELFDALADWKDAADRAREARELAMQIQYQRAVKLMTNKIADLTRAKKIFDQLGDYRDCKEKSRLTSEKLEKAYILDRYTNAVTLLKREAFDDAHEEFKKLGSYLNSAEMAEKCLVKKEEHRQKKLQAERAQRLKNARRVLTKIAVVLILIGCCVLWYQRRQEKKVQLEKAREYYSNEQYEEAFRLSRPLGGFKDADRLCIRSAREINWDAEAYESNGQLLSAMKKWEILGDYNDADEDLERVRQIYYETAQNLLKSGTPGRALFYLEALGDYKDCPELLSEQQEICYAKGKELLAAGDEAGAIGFLGNLVGYRDCDEILKNYWSSRADIQKLSGWYDSIYVIDGQDRIQHYDDGEKSGEFPFEDVACIRQHYSGVYGFDKNGRYLEIHDGYNYLPYAPDEWNHIVDADLDDAMVVLRSDGTCDMISSKEEIVEEVRSWSNIINVEVLGSKVYGLRADGTVVATSNSDADLSEFCDMAKIYSDYEKLVGIRTDGTAAAAPTGYWEEMSAIMADWTDLVALGLSDCGAFGLRSDGTVLSTIDTDRFDPSLAVDVRYMCGVQGGALYALLEDGRYVRIDTEVTPVEDMGK